MSSLINITAGNIGGAAVQTVNARELHAYLEVGKDFSTWVKDRIDQYEFLENQDFVIFPEIGEKSGRGRPSKEYAISIDMAKELAMVERNEKGKQARQYFIECERRAKAAADPMVALNDPAAMRGLLLTYSEKVLALEEKVQEMAPKARALDRISAGDKTLTVTQAAKVLGVKRESLTGWMAANGWIYRQNGSWVAYQRHIQNGCLLYKEARYTDENIGQEVLRPYCHISPKGLTILAKHLGAGNDTVFVFSAQKAEQMGAVA